MRTLLVGVFALSLGVAVACGGRVAVDDGASSSSCTPGTFRECSCSGGGLGEQRCDSSGEYAHCACTSTSTTPTATPTGPSSSPPTPRDAGTTTITDDACDGPGNVLVLDGDVGDFIHPGFVKITDATWFRVQLSPAADTIDVSLDPTNATDGDFWLLDFSTEKLGVPLAVGPHPDAERYPFEDAGHPGLSIVGDGRGCNKDFGTFTISQIGVSNGSLTSLRATFEQHCESQTAPALHGCIKLDMPIADAGP